MFIKCATVAYRALGRDGLEGSFAAFGMSAGFVWAANVPSGEGMGGLALCLTGLYFVLD
jgi:hypothetical protein